MKRILISIYMTVLLSTSVSVYSAPEEISKEQAISIATEAYPGRVLSVKRDQDVYKVKTLSDSGKVRIIIIDINDGTILSDN